MEGAIPAPLAEEPLGLDAITPAAPDISDGLDTASMDAQASKAAVSPEIEPSVDKTPIQHRFGEAFSKSNKLLTDGGPSIWAIALLSVATLALIMWKVWRLALIGAWSRAKAHKAVSLYEDNNPASATEVVKDRRGLRSKVVFAAITARETLPEDAAREETSRVAKRELGDASIGLRALELIATIAPLLGLLGTVMGMIAAFQTLQESGSRADPSLLAGGIWEALLTTAAGMAVAIPAAAALTWFEAVIDNMRRDVEDSAMRIFVTRKPAAVDMKAPLAAE
ncbi:MAG: MotA/TolQ/ExbB proton channel family protein [Shimia sp.]